jgi:hypothetical protein
MLRCTSAAAKTARRTGKTMSPIRKPDGRGRCANRSPGRV